MHTVKEHSTLKKAIDERICRVRKNIGFFRSIIYLETFCGRRVNFHTGPIAYPEYIFGGP